MLFQLCPTLVGEDRLIELDLPAFEPPHDLLELRKRILETHRGDIGKYAWIAHLWLLLNKKREDVIAV